MKQNYEKQEVLLKVKLIWCFDNLNVTLISYLIVTLINLTKFDL